MANIEFESLDNENLKNDVLKSLKSDDNENLLKSKIFDKHKKLIEEVLENSSIQIILANKNNESITELLGELLKEFEELKNQKKIESLEKDLVNNLDENSFSELIKLKSQINRE